MQNTTQTKTIWQGTKNGINLTIRYPLITDAQALLAYVNKLSAERTYLSLQGEQLTLEEEKDYLSGVLEKIAQAKLVQLLVFVDDKLVANSSIKMKTRTSKHVGIFGISVDQDYRGKGIGKLLMQTVIDEAVAQLPELQIIQLTAHADNSTALKMYSNLGFVEFGRLPDGVMASRGKADRIYMYKRVR